MAYKKIFIFTLIIIFVLLSCGKKDNVSAEESSRELIEKTDYILVNEDYIKRKNELIELIKKVPFPDQPSQFVYWILKETESFLELEKYSDELLYYALDLLQDETLTLNEKRIVTRVLISIDFEKYKYLLRDVAVLFVEGKIDGLLAGFLFFPAIPGFNFGVRNYEDPVIIEALETYIKSDEVDARTRASIIKNHLNREVD